MQVKEVLEKSTKFFRDKGIDSARLDAELLLASALKWERMQLYLKYDYPLSDAELASCREFVRRRTNGEPVAYILGYKHFYQHQFKVSSAVLIPRPETEILVETASQWIKAEGGACQILEFGAGSGCIGISLVAENPTAKLCAVEISAEAVALCQQNISVAGIPTDVSLLLRPVEELNETDLPKDWQGLADIVVANPPYIAEGDVEIETNVKKYEPRLALFSGASGLEHITAWSRQAARFSRPGAFIMFEIGADQGPKAREIFSRAGAFDDILIERDLAGHDRFVRCRRNEEKL